MNRREFLSGTTSALALTSLGMKPNASKQRPNIVLMLIDDLGYGDLACYGNTFHETPNIDALCRGCLKFTNAYAAAPVCSPSRAGILTGQHPARLHLTQWIPGVVYPHEKLLEPTVPTHLSAGTPTIASELKRLGYVTGSIGKWHLGGEGFYPENFGFDVNVAGDDHGHPAPPHGYFGPFQYHNLQGGSEQDNLTEVLTSKVEDFISGAVGQKAPFFLYLAEYAVHLPLGARPEEIAKYEHKNGNTNRDAEPDPVYAAMVESVDKALGSLRAKLDSLGVADNTIIFLTSDNGGVGFQGRNLHRVGNNGSLHGGKGYTYEGGIREPLIVHWPGVTEPGTVCDVPVFGCDFMPTFLSLAGYDLPNDRPCDGLNISPLLRGSTSLVRDTLYWHYPHYSDQGGTPSGAIRVGDWKLIEFFEDGHLELYNLKLDVGEQYDFSRSYADKAMEMQEKLRTWRQSLHGAMPTLNPNWDPGLMRAHHGALGCSVDQSPHCLED